MPICKCGRNIPENFKCFCDQNNDPVVVHYFKNDSKPNIDISNIKKEDRTELLKNNHFHALWKELHTYLLKTEQENANWLQSFTNRIPCGECKGHWLELLKDLPVDFSNQKGYFEWSVKAHNIVNKRLGKNIIDLQDAILIWNIS